MATIPAYSINGFTRPELILDGFGNIVLDDTASAFVQTYGLRALYIGCPPSTPYPPVLPSLLFPTDTNGAPDTVAEGAAANTTVGITAHATSILGFPVTYSLTADSSGGGFQIDPTTGVVSVAVPSRIDFESSPGHSYSITVRANDGILTTSRTFTIGVSDVAPSTPADANAAANTVAEGAANGTAVGVTLSATDVNGGTVTYSLTDNANGAFAINATTGVITVADSSKIDYETAAGHAYTITARASDGTLFSSTQTFTIGVSDVAPSTPTDSNIAANTVAEGAANGSTVGLTASSVDPNGPATTYSLTDNAGGRFAIDSTTGVVTVANGAAIDFETAAGHAYGITVQATSGASSTTQAFSIGVTDVGPSAPTDTNGAVNTVFEGAANGTAVGITASSTDPGGGPAPTYSLTDSAGGRFAIDPTTGIVTVANGAAIDFETATGHAYDVTVQATAGALSTTHTFSIGVGNVNEAPAGTDKAVLIAEDTTYTFGVADFGFSDPSDSSAPNSLLAVRITTVPGAGAGTLTNNGVTVNAGDSVLASDIAANHLVFTPVLNANGSPEATFTFQVQDNGGTANGGVDLDQSPNTFTINVNAGNDAPVNSVPGTQSVNEDATLTFSAGTGNAITISDVDVGSGDETVTLTVASGTLALGSTANLTSFTNNAGSITLTGTVAHINTALNGLTYHGNLNFNGTDSLVVSTSDNGNTGAGGPQNDTDSVTINVAAVNDAPVNGVPGTQSVNEDTNLVFSAANSNAIAISDVDAGAGDETVTLTVASGTLALGSTANLTSFTNNAASITLTGTVANINAALNGLTYHGNLNFNGSDTLNITTNDNGNTGSGGALSDADSLTINVTAVNDAPVNGVPGTQAVNEDTTLVFTGGNAISILDVDAGGGNETVTLSVASGALTLNGTAGLAFTVGDGTSDSTMTFSGTVGAINTALNGLSYLGNLNFNGSDTLSITTNDNNNTGSGGALSDTDSVTITVTPVNDAPVNAVPGTQTVNEDTTLVFTGGNAISISDVDIGAGNETVTLSVASGALTLSGIAGLAFTAGDGTADTTMTFSGTVSDINTALNGLSYQGNLNFNGSDTLNITTNDNGNTGSGGAQSDTDSVTINVSAVNDAPVNAVPGTQTVNEDTTLVFTGGNAISISDVDAGAGNETVTLSVASGALTLNGTAGLAFTVGDGTADSTMTFSGTVSAINTALNGLSYLGNLNFNGSDTLNLTTNDNNNTGSGGAQSDADSVTINVGAVNDAPTLTAHDRDPTYAAGGVQLFDTASASVGPADESAQAIDQLVLTVSHVSNVALRESLSIDGTTVDLVNGTTVTTSGLTALVSVTGSTATVTISMAGGIAPSAVQSLVDGLSYTNNLVSSGETARDVTITSIHDTGGTSPGVDTTTLNIASTVSFNLPPAIDSNGSGSTAAVSTAENTTAVTTVHATDPDAGPSPITYSIVGGDDAAKFNVVASGAGAGTLAFISPPDFENPTDTSTAGNNTYIVTVRAFDGASFDDQTITVTVTDVNDAPVITSNGGLATASINVNENATAVTTVTSTDQDSPAQTLTYSLAGGADQGKFSIDSSTGVLTFNTAPNFEAPTDTGGDNGYDVIVRVIDNGAPNLHDDQAVTVHVQDVNEAPNTNAITTSGAEDATSIAITVTGSDVDAGDTVASFHITGVPTGAQGVLYSDVGLTTQVTSGTDVAATGNAATVYFVPAANFNGPVTFQAAATDSHGLTDATPATETITVNAVNDAPVNNGVPGPFTVMSGFTHAITGLSISDLDANEGGTATDITTTLTSAAGLVTIGAVGGGAAITGNGSGAVTLTGSIAQINTSLGGSVVYSAADGATGSSLTTLTIATNDHGHTGTPGAITDTDVISVGVTQQVWFIDGAQTGLDASAPRGSQANPFGTVAEFNAASLTATGPGANDYIYVKAGTYTGEGFDLKTGQTLLGDDQPLSVADPFGGPAIVIETASGARPLIHVTTGQGIDLASNNTVAGIDIQTDAGTFGLDDGQGAGGNAVGNLNVSHMAISGAGQAVDIDQGGALNVTLDSLSSAGGAEGVQLGTTVGGTALTGSFSGGTGAISGSTISGFLVGDGAGGASTGGTATVSYNGTISAGAGVSTVNIQDHSTGAVTLSGNLTHTGGSGSAIILDGNSSNFTFSGATNNLTTGSSNAVNITNQSGGTVAFSGALNIDTTSGTGVNLGGTSAGTFNFTGGNLTIDTTGGNGFSATGGGTVNVTGTGNHIATTTGTALNISNTTIGSGNVTFQDISSTGSSSNAGIILDGTGSSGGLHVTGNGAAGSGGTIAGKTGADILTGTDAGGQTTSGTNGAGIYLHNTSGVQLDRMQLNDFSNFAIYGNNVTNFSLDHSTISGTNGTTNAGDREESSIRFDNLLGTASINNSSISGGYNQNVDLYNTSGTLTRLTMDNNAFGLINTTGGNDNVRGQVYNNATANYTVTNSTFAGTRADFIAFAANNNSTMDAVVRSNTFHNGQTIIPGGGTLVDIRSGSGGKVSAATTTYDISHNTALNTGADAANAFDTVGIFTAKGQDNGTMSGTIAGNTIGPAKLNANADGIFVRSAGNGTDTVLIQNNTITGYGNEGIHLQNNDGSSTMNASLFGNVLSSPNSQNFAGIFADNGATATDTSTMNLVVGSAQVGEAAKQNTLVGSGGVIDVSLSNFNASTHFNLSKNGSGSGTASGVIQDDNVLSPTVDTSGGAGAITLVNTVPALPPVVAPLLAASGGVQASTPNSGEMHLTQAELDTVVAAAIAQWAAAGASAAQLAALHATTFSIADLTGNTVGEESAPAHITIDTDAAGHGWFVDPTPSDNSEFTHAANAAGTDLFTDPSNAAASHLDLLTTVTHELGHVLGLPDSTAASDVNDLMYISLVDGERRLPDAADVPVTNTTPLTPNIALGPVVTSEMELSSAYAPVVTGTPGNDTIDAGHGGKTLVGGAGADNFVFANVEIHAATPWSLMSALWGGAPPVTPPALTHVADYSFAQGDSFDFSALTSAFHGSGASDAQIVRAVEDPSGTFATLQVNASGPGSIGSWLNMLLQGNANGPWNGTASWVNVAQLDGAHAGDPVNVLVDSQSAIHHAQIHVDLLV